MKRSLYFLIIVPLIISYCTKEEESRQKPVVTTDSVSNITETSATCKGIVTSDGGSQITSSGIFWGISEGSLINDSKNPKQSGTGAFTCTLEGLNADTKYYVQAYATNIEGTGYGNIVVFETLKKTDNTVTDIEGNIYNTVNIGSQVWLKENLKVTRYRNNDVIGTTTPDTLDISKNFEAKYQWAYKCNESNVAKYGRLYTWNVVADNRGICPVGWHVPTDEEWTVLINYLTQNGYGYQGSGSDVAKSIASKTDWKTEGNPGSIGNNLSLNNSSGFTALPSGFRYHVAEKFYDLGNTACYWSSTSATSNKAFGRAMAHFSESVNRNEVETNAGYSIRCIKD